MKDIILIIVIALCVAYGAYSVISKKSDRDASDITKATVSQTTKKTSKPVPQSKHDAVTTTYIINGIAKGADGYVAMINNGVAREGDKLEEITILKISTAEVEVEHNGSTYTLHP